MGTFIEELGRKDYAALKSHEDKANKADDGADIGSLEDVVDRSRLTISLTLLGMWSTSSYWQKVTTVKDIYLNI